MKKIQKISVVLILLGLVAFGPWPGDKPSSASTAATRYKLLLDGAGIIESSPAAADFDGDGRKEIVIGGSDGMLYVISYNGSSATVVWKHQTNIEIEAANPPTHTSDNIIRSSPAIADLDNDGHLEIVVAVGGDVHDSTLSKHRNGGILVYRFNHTNPAPTLWDFSPVSGWDWPQPKIDQVGWPPPGFSNADGYWDGIVTTPALGDLDGDGDLEIVVEGIDRRIHAWHHDGSRMAGWPISQWDGDALWRGGVSSPALGDLDGDGLPEVVVGTMSPLTQGQINKEATLWAINGDSTSVPGFPIKAEQMLFSSPALGDIDGDGQLEIVSAVGWGTSGRQNIVYAWNHDGTLLPNWPKVTAGVTAAPPALGNIAGDGRLDIVVGCGNSYDSSSCNKLYAWKDGGSSLGFEVQPPVYVPGFSAMPYSPVLADIDGNSTIEILTVHLADWGVTVVKPDGAWATPQTHQTQDGPLQASPMVDDVDNDGKLEIIVGGTNYSNGKGAIWIWDEDGSASPPPPWPMFHHDVRRTGNYCFTSVPPTNPTTISSSPLTNTWSNDNTITVNWSGATAGGCGVAGYLVGWSTSPITPGTMALVTGTSTTSPPLADGASWYLHLRTVDKGGSQSANMVHYGPFKLDTTVPTSLASSPVYTVATAAFPVTWNGSDIGSGIASYDVQVRVNSGGWNNWLTGVTTQAGYYSGAAGNTYYFQSRARDAAGNVEAYPGGDGDTSTHLTQYAFTGHVFNDLGEPVFNALVDPDPDVVAAPPSEPDGRYGVFFDTSGTYSLTVSRIGFGALPPMKNIAGGSQSGLDFYLPPESNLVLDGDLESGSLNNAWSYSGGLTPAITTTAHTGDGAVVMGGSGLSVISQMVTLPDDANPFTLSWMYRVSNPPAVQTVVTVAVVGTHTISTQLDLGVTGWTHGYLDVSDLAGETVEVRVSSSSSVGTQRVCLDEISLGETRIGVYKTYLPVISRN